MNFKNHAEAVERTVQQIRIELGATGETTSIPSKNIDIYRRKLIRKIIRDSKLNKSLILRILDITI